MISNPDSNISTAQQLAALPSGEHRYELIQGVLHVMSPAGSNHGRVAMAIGASLYNHVRLNKLGVAFAAETGFRIESNPDTVRAPDASFVSSERLADCPEDKSSFLPIAPDLAVEVISPSDVFSEVEAKAAQWLDVGCQLVLVATPEDKTLRVYRSTNKIEVLHRGDMFDVGDTCAGWQLPVDDVFE